MKDTTFLNHLLIPKMYSSCYNFLSFTKAKLRVQDGLLRVMLFMSAFMAYCCLRRLVITSSFCRDTNCKLQMITFSAFSFGLLLQICTRCAYRLSSHSIIVVLLSQEESPSCVNDQRFSKLWTHLPLVFDKRLNFFCSNLVLYAFQEILLVLLYMSHAK